MTSPFASPQEFREVMDRLLTIMSENEDMGPRLRDAYVPQRFEFSDVELVLNVRAARGETHENLEWSWEEQVDWSPRVRVTMSSRTANRYFQGHENVAYAILRRRIRTTGDLRAALELVPITKAVYPRYRELVAAEYPHLAV